MARKTQIEKTKEFIKLGNKILKAKNIPEKTKKKISALLIKRIKASLKVPKKQSRQKLLKIVDVNKPRVKFTKEEDEYFKERTHPLKGEVDREISLKPIPYDTNPAVTQLITNRQEGQIELQKEARQLEKQISDLKIQMAQQQSQEQAQKTDINFNIDKEEKRLDKQNQELLNQLETLKKEKLLTDQLLQY